MKKFNLSKYFSPLSSLEIYAIIKAGNTLHHSLLPTSFINGENYKEEGSAKGYFEE